MSQNEVKYGDLVGDNQRKVSIPARVDLRDLYVALSAIREIFGVPLRTQTKSGGIQAVAEAFANIAFEQGIVEAEDVPRNMADAAGKLELEAGWEFNTKRQQRAIAEGSTDSDLSLEKKKRGRELREKVEEEMEKNQKRDIEAEKERLKRQARESGNLAESEELEEESVDVRAIFQKIEEIGSPATALIQLGQNKGWSDEAIARELQPIVEEGKVTDELFLSIRDVFENEEPQ